MYVVPNTAGPGAYLTLRVRSPVYGVDLTTVTALSTGMLRNDGSSATLQWSIMGSTAEELLAQYAFQGNEFTGTGLYRLYPQLSVPGGTVETYSLGMLVSAPHLLSQPVNEEVTWLAVSSKVAPTSAAVSQAWTLYDAAVQGAYTLSPFQPWVKTKSAAGALALTLWAPNDGDIVILNDYLATAGAHSQTLIASAGTQIPTGLGTYGPSNVNSTPGLIQRLKWHKSDSLWTAW